MERKREVLSSVIGRYDEGLNDVPPTDLGAGVVRESINRAGIASEDAGYLVFGNVIQGCPSLATWSVQSPTRSTTSIWQLPEKASP